MKTEKEDTMKITTGTKLWIVTDPTPVSIIKDVLHPCTLPELENIIIGAALGRVRFTDKNLTIYTHEHEARADAEARMAPRD